MGFFATVETDVGDSLRVLHSNGSIGGNAIVTFLAPLSQYCLGTKVPIEVQKWFANLEIRMKETICLLTQAVYSGEWDYSEDEYQWFLHHSPQMQLTEDKFKETIQQVRQKWVNIEALLISVNELIKLLTETSLEATWWYEPGVTEKDFQALSQTLSLAAERRAQKVRIKFT